MKEWLSNHSSKDDRELTRQQFIDAYTMLWRGDPVVAAEHIRWRAEFHSAGSDGGCCRRFGLGEVLEAEAGSVIEWVELPDTNLAVWQTHR